MIRNIVLLLLVFANLSSFFSQEKYWIYLKDKAGVENDCYTYLSEKAIERRIKIGYPIGAFTDLPIRDSYINEIGNKVEKINAKSRWLNAICVEANKKQIDCISELPFVKKINKCNLSINYCSMENNNNDRLIERQISHMKGNSFKNNGFSGEGIRICVIDGGFKGAKDSPVLKHLFDNNQIIKTWDFHHKKENVYKYSYHGTAVLSCIGGKNADNIMGLAQKAEFLLAITERMAVENQSEEELWLLAAEWADANGADIINTSLGYTADEYFPFEMDGETSIISKAANLAAKKGMLVVCSAGNSGTTNWKYIATPADADSVLTVGAISGSSIHRNFSSYGPTSDHRMKPNVVAYGDVMTASKKGISQSQGTSFSSPLIAGFAACLWEMFPKYSNMEIFKLIERSSSMYPYFDYAHGHGIPQASYFFKQNKTEPTFKIIEDAKTINVTIEEKNLSKQGIQYLFVHVADENDFLNHYETIIIYKTIPYVVEKEKYKGKTLRFHFNGYTDEIQL